MRRPFGRRPDRIAPAQDPQSLSPTPQYTTWNTEQSWGGPRDRGRTCRAARWIVNSDVTGGLGSWRPLVGWPAPRSKPRPRRSCSRLGRAVRGWRALRPARLAMTRTALGSTFRSALARGHDPGAQGNGEPASRSTELAQSPARRGQDSLEAGVVDEPGERRAFDLDAPEFLDRGEARPALARQNLRIRDAPPPERGAGAPLRRPGRSSPRPWPLRPRRLRAAGCLRRGDSPWSLRAARIPPRRACRPAPARATSRATRGDDPGRT